MTKNTGESESHGSAPCRPMRQSNPIKKLEMYRRYTPKERCLRWLGHELHKMSGKPVYYMDSTGKMEELK